MLTQEERIAEQISSIEEIRAIVADLIEQAGYQNLQSEDYFLWMYSVEPYAES